MVISDCRYVIIRIGDNRILYQKKINVEQFEFCASSRHIQPLFNLIPKDKPFTLEVRNG